jgi:hypothetical protein
MKGKYLITTDKWFTAPDGKTYNTVWGEINILEDSILGVKTNRNSTNWYAQIGRDGREIIVAGCQIHYAIKCEDKPNTEDVLDWTNEGGYTEFRRPTKIYLAQLS